VGLRHFAAPLALAGFVLWSAPCRAGGPLGPNGSAITTSDYAIDMFQGPIFAGSRVTGLAGAYVAIAEDVDGDLQNPAAPAVRPFFSYTHFDYWLGFGLTFPGALDGSDFFNSGSKATTITNAPDSFVFFTPSFNLQWGELGVGFSLEMSQYALSTNTLEARDAQAIRATIPIAHIQFAHGLFNNQWVIGVGARFASLWVDGVSDDQSFNSSGSGLELGMVYKPEGLPLRVGASVRSAIRTEAELNEGFLPDENGDLVLTDSDGNEFFMPRSVALPWDVNFGFALQFGRPFNPPWRTDAELVERALLQHRLRELDIEARRNEGLARAKTVEDRAQVEARFAGDTFANDEALADAYQASRKDTEHRLSYLNRRYVQIAASMLVSGAVKDAVGVESFVSQTVNRSGERAVYSPRLGLEVSVLPELLKLRGGSYIEPTRFDSSEPRPHATVGLDLRLAVWNVFGLWPDDYVWRLGLGADIARRYSTWGLTVAGWYPRKRSEPTTNLE
jgi:hypothetical protein